MKDTAEILGASVFVSVLALMLVPDIPKLGETGAGDGGNTTISVAAAPASVETMVEAWTRPPETATDVAMAPPTPMPPKALTRLPEATPVAPRQHTAPPAPRMAPATSPRPPERPARAEPIPRPEKKPSSSSAPRVERKARGAGGGATQGRAQASEQASLSPSQRSTLMSRWGGRIQSHLARRAPRGAGRGTAVVTIRVAGNGALLGVSLARSSGNSQIDRLAVQAVRASGKFPNAPAGLGPGPFNFSVPIASR